MLVKFYYTKDTVSEYNQPGMIVLKALVYFASDKSKSSGLSFKIQRAKLTLTCVSSVDSVRWLI